MLVASLAIITVIGLGTGLQSRRAGPLCPSWGAGAAAELVASVANVQVEALSKLPHILVATPGRLLDLVDDGLLKLMPPGV
jgi:hypothetical protein